MATALQRQLAALAAPASTLLQPERRRVSIIFTSDEAAKIDRDTFYQIGLEGLAELIDIAPDLFLPFRKSILFSEASKHFERSVEDAATNEQVDELIGKFLITASPYLLLKASLKCLEWLVHRFHIERFNIEAIIECILPYYDTKHFVMVIQTLQFGGPRDTVAVDWQWLTPCIKSATVLRKATLYSNANAPFILWLFQTLKKFLTIHHSHQHNLSSYLAFIVSTIVGVVTQFSREFSIKRSYQFAQMKRKETIIHVVLNQIHRLFEEIINNDEYDNVRHNREVYSIAYVIISSIGVTAEDNPEVGRILGSRIKRIFNMLIQNRNPGLLEETYMLMDMLVHYIYFEWTFKRQDNFHAAMEDLAAVSRNWDVSKVATRLIVSNAMNPNVLPPKQLFNYISDIHLLPKVRAEIMTKVYLAYKEGQKEKWLRTLLTRFEREYPVEFEVACQNDPAFANDFATFQKGKKFEVLVEHPDENVRAQAVKKIILRATKDKDDVKKGVAKKKGTVKKKKTLKPDENRSAELLKPKFLDDSEVVLCSLLKPKLETLLQIFTPETLLEKCMKVIRKNKGLLSTRLALKKVCLIAHKLKNNEELKKKILSILIPFLFPRKPAGVITAKQVLSSSFAKQNELLSRYQPILEQTDDVTPEEMCSLSYKILTELPHGSGLVQTDTSSALDLSIAFLMLNHETEMVQLLNEASKIGFRSTMEFPVTPEGFAKCLQVAEKRKSISTELILSKILSLEFLHFSTQVHVVKFVWSLSEVDKNRGTCMNFLKSFLDKHHPQADTQFWFWLATLHKTSSLKEDCQESLSEFYLIRSLQFTSNFLKNFGIPARVKSGVSSDYNQENDNEPKRLTRSQRQTIKVPLKQTAKAANNKTERNIVRQGVSPTWCLLEVLLSKCIQHPSYRVRVLTMKTLEIIKNVPNLSVDWSELLNSILPYELEILADNSQPAVLIGVAIKDAELTSIQCEIIKTLSSPQTDREVFMGLVNICEHIGSLIYEDMEPIIKIFLETDPESKQLLALLNCFEVTEKSLEFVPKLLEYKGPAKLVLKRLSNRTYTSATNDLKKQLFALMVDSSMRCKHGEIKLAIQRCVRKWEIDATLVSDEIKKHMGSDRAPGKLKPTYETDSRDWRGGAIAILEFFQGMHKIGDMRKLLPTLFRILKLCISFEEQSPVEYLKQLTLTALTMCCEEEDDKNQKIDSGAFHVDLVIDCLRCSRNPQTHHHALILLNFAAKRFQEQVLHGVMSLFTFMGNSILRQDDAYSTQLIQQTVTTIIPALTKAGKGSNPDFSGTVVSAGVFRVFAAALQDIPVHRRLPVFTSLVETLDPNECLWQVLIIIVDNALNRDRKRSNLNADLELAVDLAWFCGPKIIVKSMAQVLQFFIGLSRLLKANVSEEDFRSLKNDQSAPEKAVFDFSRKLCYRDIQIVIHYTLELLVKIAAKFPEYEGSEEKLEYHVIVEQSLHFSRILSGLSEDKIFRVIGHRNFELVEKVHVVLEAQEFIGVVSIILGRNEVSIRRKMLDMLNLRLTQKIEWFGDLDILLSLLEPLLDLTRIQPTSEELVTLIQTAFLSLKLIARSLAFSHPEEFVPLFQRSLEYAKHENCLLCASALLCLGELFCLKSLLLPNLNEVTSAIIRAFKMSTKLHEFGADMRTVLGESMQNGSSPPRDLNNSMEVSSNRQEGDNSLTTSHLLCISTIACMNKMVEQLGSLMGSKFLKKALILVLTIDSHLSTGDITAQRKKAFDQRLRVLLKNIATKIPVRNSLIPLKGAFSSLLGFPKAAKGIMLILKDALQNTSKADFLAVLPSLCESFTEEFLAYRDKLETSDWPKLESVIAVTEVEDAAIDCLIVGAVLKMSEGTFRPYYHKIFDWAKESEARLLTFFRFSAAAAERLKSLFVTFAGYILNDAIKYLNHSMEMTGAILHLFYHLFSNDREEFVTTDRFNKLVNPLVDLVESDYILTNEIELKLLSNTLIQLAVASNDLNRWQHMIDLISMKTHHSNKQVRLNVVLIFEASASELGKDFLPLLPPVVPFLAELMNDDDTEVEAATQKMLLKLESIIGEPLQPYFT